VINLLYSGLVSLYELPIEFKKNGLIRTVAALYGRDMWLLNLAK
jgi:hypothetical protein